MQKIVKSAFLIGCLGWLLINPPYINNRIAVATSIISEQKITILKLSFFVLCLVIRVAITAPIAPPKAVRISSTYSGIRARPFLFFAVEQSLTYNKRVISDITSKVIRYLISIKTFPFSFYLIVSQKKLNLKT